MVHDKDQMLNKKKTLQWLQMESRSFPLTPEYRNRGCQ